MMSPSPSVTIVDDDAQVRRALARVLKAYGFSTRECASAEDFLADGTLCADCLVLDVDLGGMSGIDLYRAIAQRDGAAPPAVFVTGKSGAHVEATACALGGVELLFKPVDAARLVEAIRRAQGSSD
jgi:FixJ family two-component response regulator